jgi:hypothetical protein
LYTLVIRLDFSLIYFVCAIFLLIFKKKRIKKNKRKEKTLLVWVYGAI